MALANLTVRPFRSEDAQQLDLFRDAFKQDGEIALPWGYTAEGVETAIVERDRIIGATHGTKAVIINFMKDPAAPGTDIYAAVLMGERALTYVAQQNGCVEAYCAIPEQLTGYIDMVRRSGYEIAFPGCVVLRRGLKREQSNGV